MKPFKPPTGVDHPEFRALVDMICNNARRKRKLGLSVVAKDKRTNHQRDYDDYRAETGEGTL